MRIFAIRLGSIHEGHLHLGIAMCSSRFCVVGGKSSHILNSIVDENAVVERNEERIGIAINNSQVNSKIQA